MFSRYTELRVLIDGQVVSGSSCKLTEGKGIKPLIVCTSFIVSREEESKKHEYFVRRLHCSGLCCHSVDFIPVKSYGYSITFYLTSLHLVCVIVNLVEFTEEN